MRPLIGQVALVPYIRFLMLYRRIVEQPAKAYAKIAAVHLLGQTKRYAGFYGLHRARDSAFPASRFHLTADGLQGVGAQLIARLRAGGLDSFGAIAAADSNELAHVISRRLGYAERLKIETQAMLARGTACVVGEAMGPRVTRE